MEELQSKGLVRSKLVAAEAAGGRTVPEGEVGRIEGEGEGVEHK